MSTEALVDNIFAILSDRKGFDWWWDDIEEEYKTEIFNEIVNLINESRYG